MSRETFDRIQAAIVLLLAVEFFWWVGWFLRQTKSRRKAWALYLPAGAAVGAIVGVIVGPGVCQPGTAIGALVGMVVGEQLFKRF
jgi:hypothetical protein